MAANHISKDKIVGSFFNRANHRADISGNVPSDHFVTSQGRKGRRTAEKVKIQNDIQFPGKVPKLNDVDQIIRATTAMGANTGPTKISSYFLRVYFEEIGNEYQYILHGGNYAYVALSTAVPHNVLKVAGNAASGTLVDYTFSNGIPVAEWITLALVYDNNTQSANLYINGVSADEGFQPLANSYVVQNFGTYRTIENLAVKGGFKDFAHWTNYQLTPDDLSRLQFSNKLLETADNWIPMEDGMLQDVIGGNHATITADDGNVFNNSIPAFNSFFNEKGYNKRVGVDFVDGTISFAPVTFNASNLTVRVKLFIPDVTKRIGPIGKANDNAVYFLIVGLSNRVDIRLSGVGGSVRYLYTNEIKEGYNQFEFFTDDNGNCQDLIINGKAIAPDENKSFGGNFLVDQFLKYSNFNDSTYPQFTGGVSEIYISDTINEVYAHCENGEFVTSVASTVTGKQASTQSVIVPASLVDSDYDILGSLLEFKGGLAPRLQLTNAPCVNLNGVDQYIISPAVNFQPGNLVMSTNIYLNSYSGGGNKHFLSCYFDTSNFFTLGHDASGYLRLVRYNGVQINTLSTLQLQLNTWHSVSIERVSDTIVIFTLDGISEELTVLSVPTILNNYRMYLGTFSGTSGYTDAKFCNARVSNNNSDVLHIPCSEGNGTTIYDASGNDSHGTIINAILPDVWETQDIYHYNFMNGFSNANEVVLDGTNQYLSMSEDFNDLFSNDGSSFQFFAGEITFKLDDDSSVNYLMSNRADNTGHFQISCWNSPVSRTHFHIVEQIGEFSLSSPSPFDGAQHKLFFAIFKRGTLMVAKFFMDGALLGEISKVLTDLDAEMNPIAFGNSSGSNFGLKGAVNDIKLWSEKDRSLTEAEIDLIGLSPDMSYQSNASLRSTYWYPFKELGEVDIKDVNGNGAIVSHQSLPVNSNNPSCSFYKSIPGVTPNQDVLGNQLDNRGYNSTGLYNGASGIQFPDIPNIPADLRGDTFSTSELEGLAYSGRILNTKSGLTLFQEKVKSIHFKRKGVRLLLDDYPAICPSTALQKIHSDFAGDILTIRNEDNLQDASFGFDEYGRLPEADIIEHLNGTANGRVTTYNFQNVEHLGSGYTRDILSEMPYIAKSGVIQKDSRGIPALRFDGGQRMIYESQTAFKSMHDGTRGVQVLGFQVDEDQNNFWIIGNTDFASTVGFEFLGDVFSPDKLHFVVRTNTQNSAIQDVQIPYSLGEYNRLVNYIDPSNPIAIDRHLIYANESHWAANTHTQSPSTGNSVDGTTTIGYYASRSMEGYINELIFLGNHKKDMLKLSRSLMFLP